MLKYMLSTVLQVIHSVYSCQETPSLHLNNSTESQDLRELFPCYIFKVLLVM